MTVELRWGFAQVLKTIIFGKEKKYLVRDNMGREYWTNELAIKRKFETTIGQLTLFD